MKKISGACLKRAKAFFKLNFLALEAEAKSLGKLILHNLRSKDTFASPEKSS